MDEYTQQHPIPQQISSYEFRLVGDMTIKQFFQVAGGALAALFFYSTSLPVYFRVPLIVVSILLGLALAFFPLQDRPLSQWIILFAKSIYTPTMFIWSRLTVSPQYFQSDSPLSPSTKAEAKPDLKIPSVNVPKIETRQGEDKPNISIKTDTVVERVPESKQIDQPPESARLEKSENEFLSKVAEQFTSIVIDVDKPVIHTAQPAPVEAKREPVKIPDGGVIQVEKTEKPTLVAPPELKTSPATEYKLTPVPGSKPQDVKAPEFSQSATPPAPPITPNVVVGQVIDVSGRIIEGAIVEIRDSDGRPVRALKTNRLGHFMIATPLSSGKYIIITEKGDIAFDHVEIEAKGEVIQPIAIRAKGN